MDCGSIPKGGGSCRKRLLSPFFSCRYAFLSVSGIYAKERKGTSATDTVIDRLMLFPALKSSVGLKLTFSSGQVIVRERQISVPGLVLDNDVYVIGRWDARLTTLAQIFSTLFYNNSRSGD